MNSYLNLKLAPSVKNDYLNQKKRAEQLRAYPVSVTSNGGLSMSANVVKLAMSNERQCHYLLREGLGYVS